MDDVEFRALLDRVLEERRATAPPPRPPRSPFAPEWQRPERRTRPAHRDPTGDAAVGRLTKKEKRNA